MVRITSFWAQSLACSPSALGPRNVHVHHTIIMEENGGFNPTFWADCPQRYSIHDNVIYGEKLWSSWDAVQFSGSCGGYDPITDPGQTSRFYDNEVRGVVAINAPFITVHRNYVRGWITVGNTCSNVHHVRISENVISSTQVPVSGACTANAEWSDNHWSGWDMIQTITPSSSGWVLVWANTLMAPTDGRVSVVAFADPNLLGSRDLWLKVEDGATAIRLAPDACYCLTNDPFPSIVFPAGNGRHFNLFVKIEPAPAVNVDVTVIVVEA